MAFFRKDRKSRKKEAAPPADDFMATALKRFEHAKEAWSEVREAFTEDSRYVNVEGGQWDASIRDGREDVGKPALEFNELHLPIQQVVNHARQERPQPKVTAGDNDATSETADFWEGRLRHIQYASQADVAYDGAVEPAATGGLGFYRIEREYVDDGGRNGKPSFNQEPRIRRILDPLTQYPDPAVQEPDFSDAKWWFDRWWMEREAFEQQFQAEPIPFDDDCNPDWANEDQVCVARYWEVIETPRRYVRLADGREDWADQLGEFAETDVDATRDVPQRKVMCHIIDGEKKIQSDEWPGRWIPIIAVVGREVVVNGKRYLISVIRFAKDAQKLKNAYKSGIANLLQLASTAPWTGPTGMFKNRGWTDSHLQNYAYLEWDPVYDKQENLIPAKPERNTFEAPIQALAAAAIACSDDIRRSAGYLDSVLQPSKADLSGVAVMRRTQQADLNNLHYQDNLIRSQYHCARVVLDLDMALADTPRILKARKVNGDTFSRPVMPDGNAQMVEGWDPQHVVRIDRGRFDLEITTGPGYDTKREEERDALMEILKADPAAWQLYSDVLFELMGYRDLAERARLALPPAIQQGLQAQQKGIPPQAIAIITQLTAQKQQLQQALQKLMTMLETKQIETKGKLDIERLKLIRALMETQMQHAHDFNQTVLSEKTDAIEHLMQILQTAQAATETATSPTQSQQQAA